METWEKSSINPQVRALCDVIDLLTPCMDDYLYVYDFENDFYYISVNVLNNFTFKSNCFNEVVKNHQMFVYPPDLPALQADLNSILDGTKNTHNMKYRWMDKNNKPIWINCRGTVVRDKDTGKLQYMAGCINEIGARQKADNISGFLNLTSLKELLASYTGPFPSGYIMRIGIDDFKELHEKLGLEYCDNIIYQTAKCINKCISSHHCVYRASSADFIILDFFNGTYEDGFELYKNIRHAIDTYVEENNYDAVFTISAGLLMCEAMEEYDFNTVFKLSDFSLNSARRNGKNCCYLFSNEDYDRFLNRRSLLQKIKQSVDNNFEGFRAYFQPLINTYTQTLYGAETLLRFYTEDRGIVSPAEFIPLLEESGLIIPVGKWVLHEALKACRKIQEVIHDFKISINVSYIQVLKSDIIDEIISSVDDYGINPSCVIIELTESGQLTTNQNIKKMWDKLKRHGIMVALDDFGTGYSNFHYLYDLRPDILKIDRSFTVQAMENEYEYNLLTLISDMGHNLRLKICIEGIENDNELNRMMHISPEYCQGYFFGHPCPYDDFHKQFVQLT